MTQIALPAPMAYMPFLPGLYNVTTSIGSDSAFAFTAADYKMGFVFQAPSTTPPDQIKFRCSSFTSTGTIDVTIETLDFTTGFPSGTKVLNTNLASVSVASTGVKTVTGLSGTGTLAVGTLYAIVLTATGGFAGSLSLLRTTGINGGTGHPYALTKTSAGAWTKISTSNCGFAIGFFDSGGTAINMPGFAGAYTAANQAYATGTNPNERGNRFSLPFPATYYGAVIFLNLGGSPADVNSFELNLYSSHTTGSPSLLANTAIDGDASGVNMARIILSATPVDLAANTVYAHAVRATGSGNVSFLRYVYASAAETGCHLDVNMYSTTRNGSSGAFTDVTTDVYAIYPLISRLSDGAGGGVQYRANMSGNV